MNGRTLFLAVVLVCGAACAPGESAPAAAQAGLRFVDMPAAYIDPDDDVDDARAGLQIAVTIALDRTRDAVADHAVSDLSLTGPVDAAAGALDAVGQAQLVVTVPSAAAPVDVTLVATATIDGVAVTAERRVTVARAGPAPFTPPPPVTCTLAVASNGAATVTCSGGDAAHPAMLQVARGGLIGLTTTSSSGERRGRQAQLQGGTVTVPFAFAASGAYDFDAVLDGSADATGATVRVSTSATVTVD